MNPTKDPKSQHNQLVDQVQALDEAIHKISGWFNFHKIQSGSLMISGTNAKLKEDHSLLHWGAKIPFPVELMKKFFEQYGQELIAKRNLILEDLTKLLIDPSPEDPPTLPDPTPRTATPLPGTVHNRHCNDCGQITQQKFGFYDADGSGQKVSAGYECLTCKTFQP